MKKKEWTWKSIHADLSALNERLKAASGKFELTNKKKDKRA